MAYNKDHNNETKKEGEEGIATEAEALSSIKIIKPRAGDLAEMRWVTLRNRANSW